jgi:predicted methyltransferase
MVDVYHHVDARDTYLRRLRDSLKSGGQVAVIDFRMDAPVGPPPSSRVDPDQVKAEFVRAGFVLAAEHRFLPNQYFLVFRPAQ